MKTYKAKFNGTEKGVYAISLVEDPAMEGHFIALKKHEIQLKTLDEEKRLLIGLVLEPEKPIYRNQDGEEFNLVFDSPTITQLSHAFLKNGFQLNSTLEHQEPIEGVSFVESWIVEDPKIDKSAVFGLTYPKGSWIATMKVENDEVWNDYVKLGKVKGFSVDAMIDLEEVNLKSHIKMTEKIEAPKGFLAELTKMKEDLLSALNLKKEVKLGMIKSGDVTIEFEGEAIVQGAEVWMTAEDGTRVPLPVGDYELENGMLLSVTEEGYANEIKEKMAEEPKEQQTMSDEQMGEITNAIKSIMIKYSEDVQAKIDEVKSENVKLKTQLEETNEKLVKLSEQPATKKIVSQPTQLSTTKKSLVEFLNEKI